MYQPYPAGEHMPGRPQPPSALLTAVKIMYVGAGLETLNLVLSLANLSRVGSADTVGPILGIALWLWMARANRAGKSWARIMSTVLFGLDCLFLLRIIVGLGALSSIGGGTALLALVLIAAIVIWLLGLGAVVLLWRKESSAYFSAMSGS